jgi:hypothetical protein
MGSVEREPGFRVHRDHGVGMLDPTLDEGQRLKVDKTECVEAQVAGKYVAAWVFTVTMAFVAYVIHLVFGG